MELSDALGEEAARFLRFRRHLEMDLAGAGNEHGGLARSLVEDFAMIRVTRGRVGFFGRFLRREGRGKQEGGKGRKGVSYGSERLDEDVAELDEARGRRPSAVGFFAAVVLQGDAALLRDFGEEGVLDDWYDR